MDETFTFDEILERLKRRADGEPEALDPVWAQDTTGWRSFSPEDTPSSAARRSELARSEFVTFRKAMPDFTRESTFIPSEQESTIVELSSWKGTSSIGAVRVEVCLVYRIADGQIQRVEMYADSGQFGRLSEALKTLT